MAHASRSPRRTSPIEDVREHYKVAEALEPGGNHERYVEALKAFLAVSEQHSAALTGEGAEVAGLLDEAAMAFYRASNPGLARRAIDLGLRLGPGTSTLLHHKALILLALNEDLPTVVELVDQALEANPHDKGLWATRGDALRLLERNEEAVQAYLRAQELDAASTQDVDRALKLAPNDPRALRVKLDLARALGGDLQALAACDELLKSSPDDIELLHARADVLAALGRFEDAIENIERVRSLGPEDVALELLHVRVLFQLKRSEEAVPLANALVSRAEPPDGATLEQIASIAGSDHPELALAARERLREVEPRNVQNLLNMRALASRLGRVDTALTACSAVLAASPDNLEAMRGIAELQAGAGRVSEAIEAYRAVAKAHPHAVGELHKALEVARDAQRPEAVREFAEAILSVDPTDAGARVALARGLAASGDLADAMKEYDALLAAHPGELPVPSRETGPPREVGRPNRPRSAAGRAVPPRPDAHGRRRRSREPVPRERLRVSGRVPRPRPGGAHRARRVRAVVLGPGRRGGEPPWDRSGLAPGRRPRTCSPCLHAVPLAGGEPGSGGRPQGARPRASRNGSVRRSRGTVPSGRSRVASRTPTCSGARSRYTSISTRMLPRSGCSTSS